MVRLRNLLDDSAKARRHRKNLLNVQVTFLAWFAESIGFLIIFLGTFVLGHENNFVNFCLQTITLFMCFNLLPCIFLLKDSSELKINILDSSWYDNILVMFCCHYNEKDDDVVQRNVLENVHHEQNVRREEDIATISLASIENGDDVVQRNVLENVHHEQNVRREEDIAIISLDSIENGDEIGSINNVNIPKTSAVAAENSSTKMKMYSRQIAQSTNKGKRIK